MAKSKSSVRKSRRGRGGKASARLSAAHDAIALLKADHRQVQVWFEQFQSTRSGARKQVLAGQICQALKVHTQIEEELFYPAFLAATGEVAVHHEAEVEHNGAKRLIDEIASSGAEDEYFDAKVTVLAEMIRHHVNEEERRDGMFAKARQSEMDLAALGQRLASRKAELTGMMEAGEEEPASRSTANRRSGGGVARLAKPD
jgi:hemerythrin superfamily protein